MLPLIACIVCGGAGTRLWPVSREELPKPFIRLEDGQSLLQKTFLRAAALPGVERILIVTNQSVLFRTLDECQAVNDAGLPLDLILEPVGRNTGPAIATAALDTLERLGDAQLLVLPADHLITDQAAFADAVGHARHLADAGHIVTFGLKPEYAETGYGYIEQGDAIGADGSTVRRFVEKPDLATAESYVASGRYLWNSGMFCFGANVLRDELATLAPELLAASDAALAASPPLVGARYQRELQRDAFARCPNISIDYALMERTARAAVVPCSLGWSDIGSWESYASLSPADAAGNRLSGEVLEHDSHGCFVQARDRLVGLVGVHDLVVVDTPDALLVAARDRSQEVRELVTRLRAQNHPAYRQHRTSHRPWGTYTVLEEGPRFKIKRIVVKPGASLSLQMHHHRSEHWIVVSGTARVTNGEAVRLVHTNESTFIPAGERHRLSNPGVIPLVLIEVQSGEYLGEDDIVRMEDNYGRH